MKKLALRRRGNKHFGVMLLRVAVVAFALTAGTHAHARRAQNKTTVEVEPGQTLWGIAKRHGCSVEALRTANALGEGALVVGTQLELPKPCTAGDTSALHEPVVHVVAAGDTLAALAQRYDTSIDALERLNGLDGSIIRVGQKLRVGEAARPKVRVVPGQSVGRPQRGKLAEGVQLPYDRAYYRRRPQWAFGAQHVVDHTRAAIEHVLRKHPNVHRLAVGDLSAKRGGRIPGHRSHQSGRDIDLGLYFERAPAGYPHEFVPAEKGTLDLAATWALVEALYVASKRPGGPEKIFLDYGLQELLYAYARKQGTGETVLQKIFQVPNGRWAKSLVQHEPFHDDHIHVRYGCPPKDERCR